MSKKESTGKGRYVCHKCGATSDMPLNRHQCVYKSYASLESYHEGRANLNDLHPIDRKILEEQS